MIAKQQLNTNRKDASKITIAHNKAMTEGLNWDDQQSFDDAAKGFIATMAPLTIKDANGNALAAFFRSAFCGV